jgi:hypothetical protein
MHSQGRSGMGGGGGGRKNSFANIQLFTNFPMDLFPNEQNFDLDKSRQSFHHSLKEHH